MAYIVNNVTATLSVTFDQVRDYPKSSGKTSAFTKQYTMKERKILFRNEQVVDFETGRQNRTRKLDDIGI